MTLTETGDGTVSIGGTWGLDHCTPHQLKPTVSDGNTIDLAIEIFDGDILCTSEDEWFLTEDVQFVDDDEKPFHPSQLQLNASFYIDNITTGVRELASGPFSVSEKTPRSPVAYLMRGKVLESISLVPADFDVPPHLNVKTNEWGVQIFDAPAEFYLKINSVEDWSFSLSLLAGDATIVTHLVTPGTSPSNITKNVLNIESDHIQVSFSDLHGLFERFDFSTDLKGGTGTWDWFSDCPVCDLGYALPAANGTIHTIEPAPIFELDCSLNGRVGYSDLHCSNDAGTTSGLLEELALLPGDLDGNGSVEFSDFLVLANNFGPYRRTYPQGDIDGDEKVGMSDFLILAENFSKSSRTVVSAPEAGSLGILPVFALFLARGRNQFLKHGSATCLFQTLAYRIKTTD